YVECPHCKEKIDIYGKGHTAEIAKKYGLKVLGEIPLRADISQAADEGKIETIENHYLDKAVKLIKSI
ncbi:MAG: P-loop NTPase, partial [Firmicutes bacterium]|nr:P-loop NTPase [Bacillota bacterium]